MKKILLFLAIFIPGFVGAQNPLFASYLEAEEIRAGTDTLEIDSITQFHSNLIIESGATLTVASDTDASTTLGRALIDSRTTDIAHFSHFDMSAAGQEAISHTAVGTTGINAATGQSINLGINALTDWQINSSGDLTGSSGNTFTVASDEDATTILGRIRLDSRITDQAIFSHFDLTTVGNYALAQTALSQTRLNAGAGRFIDFEINGVRQWQLDGTGDLTGSAANDLTVDGDIDLNNTATNQLLLPLNNNATNPTLAFGDGNTGFFESSDNTLITTTGGVARHFTNSAGIFMSIANSPQIGNFAATSTTPNLITSKADTDTGIGRAADDQLSLIAGAVEGIRITESGAAITVDISGDINLTDATAALDFGSTAAQSSTDLTITLTGAAIGDIVLLGAANASVLADSNFSAWVSATNTITVRFNNYSAGALDPASGTFKVTVIK